MAEGYEIFEGWVEKVKGEIESGSEVKVVVKSLDSFEKMAVLAKISRTKDDLPDSESLRVVNDMGEKKDELFIKTLSELGDEDFVRAVES